MSNVLSGAIFILKISVKFLLKKLLMQRDLCEVHYEQKMCTAKTKKYADILM